jgi:hypothetical protein
MTISVVFDPPLPADSPAVFNSKAFTLVGDLNTFSTQANSTASDINAQVTDPGVVAIGADLTGANTIGAVAAIKADVSAVAAIKADVSAVAAIKADVSAVAANEANINAAVADLPSLAAKVSKTGDTMTGDLSVPSLNGGQLAGHRNKLINGDFSQNARALTSAADDAYCLDRWYVLTETGNVTVGKLTDPESGAPWGIRLTQPDATAKRIGFAQIIESKDIRQYASTAMNLSARLRLSTAANIRYAVIEHTGTANAVTSDVVNDWASATFTPSNFFIAGVNIISTGTIAPGAATWGSVSDWDAPGATVKNVIVFIWTESQVAQNVTLDCSRIQYEPGVVATPHEWRINEMQLCQRYYCETRGAVTFTAAAADNSAACSIFWPVEMRDTPATTNVGGTVTNASSATLGNISKYGARFLIAATAAGVCGVADRIITASAEL